VKKKVKNKSGRVYQTESVREKLAPELRSQLMSKVHSSKTKLEKDFVELLRSSLNQEFEVNFKNLRGRPDIVFWDKKVCIFLDSNFWHGWQYPRWKHKMKNEFWRQKIEMNRLRDRRNTQYLKRNNWKVFRFWEHEIKTEPLKLIEQIQAAID